MKNIKKWFEIIRARTLPVSMASVIMAVALAFEKGENHWLPATLCLLFAMLAQATSNVANDYADFKTGCDNKDSLSPDRKLVSGEVSLKTITKAIIILASLSFIVGFSLIYWGGWILLPFGLLTLAVVFLYSMGPFPLSYNALGDVAVLLFYGIIPVTFTYYILTHEVNWNIITAGIAMGLIVDELLIVNNVRDEKEDKLFNKVTTVGIFGSRFMKTVFLLNPFIACLLGFYFMKDICDYKTWSIAIIPLLIYSTSVYVKLEKYQGKQLNKLLGQASLEAIFFALTIVAVTLISNS